MSTLKFAHALSKRILQDARTISLEDYDWQNTDTITDLEKAYRMMSTLYVKYILLANSLTKLINIVINYNKRELMKPILSNLFGRIVELKAEISNMKKTDVPYLDDILKEMGVSRKELELLVPEYYRMERALVVKEFFKYTDKIKEGLVLKQFPNKPVPELALDLRKYFLAEAQNLESGIFSTICQSLLHTTHEKAIENYTCKLRSWIQLHELYQSTCLDKHWKPLFRFTYHRLKTEMNLGLYKPSNEKRPRKA